MGIAIGDKNELFPERHGAKSAGKFPLRQRDYSPVNSNLNAGNIPHMPESLLDRIDERLRITGLNDSSACERAGIDRNTIRDLRRRKKKSITLPNLKKLAEALGTTVAWLSGSEEEPPADPPSETVPPTEIQLANIRPAAGQSLPQDVPVMGTAAGSVIMQVEGFQFEGGQVDTVRRPPGLAGAKDLYAIYVSGDSMFPAHNQGDLRFVHPHRPVRIGDTVIVVTRNHDHDPGQAYIKVLKRRTAEKLILEQYNPPATIEVAMAVVKSVHLVLTMNDLYGV